MTRKTLLTLLVFVIAACASAAPPKRRAAPPLVSPLPSSASPALWAGLEPGPLHVGFKTWDMRLQAADFPRGPQHLIQMDIWYPAIAGTGTAMTFRDYLIPKFTETHYADPTDADRDAMVDDFRKSVEAAGIGEAAANGWIDAPVYARAEAMIPPNKLYPIIGIVPDAGDSLPQEAILAEYLASYGFIVVTTPSMTRFDPLTSGRTMALQEEQQDDIDRVVSQIGGFPSTLDIPVSIVGIGFGADAAVLYAMHPRQPANAIVLVDPQFSPERVTAMKSSTMFDAAYRIAPVLEIHSGNPDLGFVQSLNISGLTAQRGVRVTTTAFAAAAFPEIAKAIGAPRDIAAEVNATARAIQTFISRIWAPVRPPI